MANDIDTEPEAIRLTVYQNDDSDLEWFPFGEALADIPEDFADYDYILDVWQGKWTESTPLLLTSNPAVDPHLITVSRNDATGMITFRFPREVMLAFNIVDDMRYDVREIEPGVEGQELTIFAGVFRVTVRGTITGT